MATCRYRKPGRCLLELDLQVLVRIGLRNSSEQRPRVGVLGVAEDGTDGALFDNPAQIHDGDAVGRLGDHRQLVCDEDHGEAELLLQILEQVQQLRLHRYVQRAHGLIGDEYLGSDRKGACDSHALALPAAQLARVLSQPRWPAD